MPIQKYVFYDIFPCKHKALLHLRVFPRRFIDSFSVQMKQRHKEKKTFTHTYKAKPTWCLCQNIWRADNAAYK